MTDFPLTETELKYLKLATDNDVRLKLIQELESAFLYERDPETKREHDQILADARAQYHLAEKQMRDLYPQFKTDQDRRHAHDLANTDYGRSLKAPDDDEDEEPSM